MKCKRCGNTVLPNQVFCNRCGAPIEDDGKGSKSSLFDDETTEKNGKSKFIIILSILVAAIIILLILLLILNGRDKTNTNNSTQQNTDVSINVTEIGGYTVNLPETYSYSNSEDNLVTIYNEQSKALGEIKIKEITYAKATSKLNQAVQAKVNSNYKNCKFTIESQEKKQINNLDCTLYKIKCIDKTNASEKSYILYTAVVKVSETTSALAISAASEDEAVSYSKLEKLVDILKTVQKNK